MSGMVIGGALLAVSVFCGILAAKREEKRHAFFRDGLQFFRFAKAHVTTFKSTPADLFSGVPCADFYERYAKNDTTVCPAGVSDEEISMTDSFLLALYKSDYLAVQGVIQSALCYLEEKERDTRAAAEKNGKLYRKLGFFAGVALFLFAL